MGDESMEHIRFHLRFNIFSQRPADPNVFKKNPGVVEKRTTDLLWTFECEFLNSCQKLSKIVKTPSKKLKTKDQKLLKIVRN